MSKLTVTYIKHSGFLIETANSYLLFDYWQENFQNYSMIKNFIFFQVMHIMTIIQKIFLN